MPSYSEKQAKTMSAIAHGWKPTGEAADIPVSVAKDFHAADKSKKYGKKAPKIGGGESKPNYDRSSHQKGNPGFGAVPEGHKPDQTYAQEQAEHAGPAAACNPSPAPNKGHQLAASRVAGAHGFGHTEAQCCGPLRKSGHSGAHQVGKKRK